MSRSWLGSPQPPPSHRRGLGTAIIRRPARQLKTLRRYRRASNVGSGDSNCVGGVPKKSPPPPPNQKKKKKKKTKPQKKKKQKQRAFSAELELDGSGEHRASSSRSTSHSHVREVRVQMRELYPSSSSAKASPQTGRRGRWRETTWARRRFKEVTFLPRRVHMHLAREFGFCYASIARWICTRRAAVWIAPSSRRIFKSP